MGKIGLIIQREYLTRVKKKSFIIMTLLGPLLMVGLMAGIIYFAQQESEPQTIMVIEQEGPIFTKWKDGDNYSFEHLGAMGEAEAKKLLKGSNYTSMLYFPANILANKSPLLYYKVQPSLMTQRAIENEVEAVIEREKLKLYNVDKSIYKKIKEGFNMRTIKLTDSGDEEEGIFQRVMVGFGFGLMVYFFIFFFGVQVMRGVIEEKTNRIVEVVITSVKPFQLMMGKIIGIALVGLTQFLLWVILSTTMFSIATSFLANDRIAELQQLQAQQSTELLAQNAGQMEKFKKVDMGDFNHPDHIINRINWPLMLGTFVFYFLGGYLLYGALFAAIGSAVDNETDTQQFMLPVTLPLLGAYIMSTFIMQNPEGDAAFWGSLIPFTSPIIMPIRMAMGMDGHLWELILSMVLLVLTFIGATWFAGKIYRTGILMYGKKVSYKEIWKWIRFNG